MFSKRHGLIFTAAFLSFLVSVFLWFGGNKEAGQYVSVWVPSIIGVGIYIELLAQVMRKEAGK